MGAILAGGALFLRLTCAQSAFAADFLWLLTKEHRSIERGSRASARRHLGGPVCRRCQKGQE
jgi:hypothetical protein